MTTCPICNQPLGKYQNKYCSRDCFTQSRIKTPLPSKSAKRQELTLLWKYIKADLIDRLK